MNSKYAILFLPIIIAASFILRFYILGQNPPSLNVDEVSQGYNAYSILKTGKDEYGSSFPLIFRSLETYNPPIPIYSLVPSIKLFGLNDFAIRFPSALAGVLTIIVSYLLTQKIFRNYFISISTSIFLLLSPWHIHFSRFFHEANMMIFFTLTGLLLFLHSKNRHIFLIFSSLSFGIAINTFHGAKLWVALFMASIVVFNFKNITLLKSKLIIPFFILLIFSLPTILNLEESFIRPNSVTIFQRDKPINLFISGYLSHFSPNFLFLRGDYIGRHSTPGIGQLYVFQFPLILLGIAYLFKKKNKYMSFLILWFLIAPLPAAISQPTPHAARSLSFIPLWSILSALGLYSIKTWQINYKLKISTILILILVIVYNVFTYHHLYYVHYPKEKALDWNDGYKQMVDYVKNVEDNYENVAITNYLGNAYIFMLFYSKYDPANYHQTNGNKIFFGKYEFFKGFPTKFSENTLVINVPENDSIQEIKMNNGDTVFVAKD